LTSTSGCRANGGAFRLGPWQKLGDALDRVIGDRAENAAQISLGSESVELGRFNEGVDRSGALAADIRAGKEVVLPPESQRPDGALGGPRLGGYRRG
jgi:hypothetical protein